MKKNYISPCMHSVQIEGAQVIAASTQKVITIETTTEYEAPFNIKQHSLWDVTIEGEEEEE